MLLYPGVNCGPDDPDMARKTARPLNAEAIERYHTRLKAATYDRDVFRHVLDELASDKSLTAADAIEIATNFTLGHRAASRKAAVLAIGQERARLSLAESKSASAVRAKSWL